MASTRPGALFIGEALDGETGTHRYFQLWMRLPNGDVGCIALAPLAPGVRQVKDHEGILRPAVWDVAPGSTLGNITLKPSILHGRPKVFSDGTPNPSYWHGYLTNGRLEACE
jgi:hypothetical protein